MRISYFNEGGCVGVLFLGRRVPLDDVAKKYGFSTMAIGKASGQIYQWKCIEGPKKAEMQISSSSGGLMVTGYANDKEFISSKLNEMLMTSGTTALPENDILLASAEYGHIIRQSAREFCQSVNGEHHA